MIISGQTPEPGTNEEMMQSHRMWLILDRLRIDISYGFSH